MTVIFLRNMSHEAAMCPASPMAVEPRRSGRDEANTAWWTWVREAWRRRRSRTYVTQLDDHMLKDIGITRAEAEWEANKPFWL